MSLQSVSDNASSSITGIILLVGITFILAMLVLLIFLGFRMPSAEPTVPKIFVISKIQHINPYGILDYDSYVVLEHTGKIRYDNRNLFTKAYRNGEHVPCDIPTMNGNDFLSTNHYGIQKLGGLGSHNYYWYPGQTIYIDYAKGTFHPGDVVRFDVYDRTTGRLISRDTWPHTTRHDAMWFYNYFLSPQDA